MLKEEAHKEAFGVMKMIRCSCTLDYIPTQWHLEIALCPALGAVQSQHQD